MRRDMSKKVWRTDPGGYLIHDGDCTAWDTGLCTCGLLHHLMPVGNPQKYAPDFWEQRAKHEAALLKIQSPNKRD